jgi:RNA recognition motif-containing protein
MVQKNKLFVGNLSYDFDEASLRDILTQIFAEYGTVEKVEVPIDRMTNRTKGIAFVTMSTDEEASNAQEALDGYELAIDAKDKYPRPMKVDIARPMKPRENNFGGGSSSGGYKGGNGGGRGGYSNGGGRDRNSGYSRDNSFDEYSS